MLVTSYWTNRPYLVHPTTVVDRAPEYATRHGVDLRDMQTEWGNPDMGCSRAPINFGKLLGAFSSASEHSLIRAYGRHACTLPSHCSGGVSLEFSRLDKRWPGSSEGLTFSGSL